MSDWLTRYHAGVSIGHAMNDPLGMQAERERTRARESRYRDMTDTEILFAKASDALAVGLADALSALAAHEAERDRLPAQFYRDERARLVRAAQVADSAAVAAVTEYQMAAVAEARRLRSAAEAAIDPAARVAALTEARALAESGLDAEELLRRAQTMLEDGQPGRASVHVDAVRARGGRSPLSFQRLAREVEATLDETDPTRASALRIERAVESNLARFRQARLAALRDGGVGVNAQGEAGSGASGQVAVASAASKLGAWIDQHGGEIGGDDGGGQE